MDTIYEALYEGADGRLYKVCAATDWDFSPRAEYPQATSIATFGRETEHHDPGDGSRDLGEYMADLVDAEVGDPVACDFAMQGNVSGWTPLETYLAPAPAFLDEDLLEERTFPTLAEADAYIRDRLGLEADETWSDGDADAVQVPGGGTVVLFDDDDEVEEARRPEFLADRVRQWVRDEVESTYDIGPAHRLLEAAGVVVEPVYALVHGGVSFSKGGFSDSWDSGMAGVQTVSKERVMAEVTSFPGPDGKPVPVTDDNWREAASWLMGSEFDEFSCWAENGSLCVFVDVADRVDPDDPWDSDWQDGDTSFHEVCDPYDRDAVGELMDDAAVEEGCGPCRLVAVREV